MKRFVYIVSDGTGITAESLANSLMTQFENIDFVTETIPYLDTLEKTTAFVAKINQYYHETQTKPLIFTTLVNPDINIEIKKADAAVFDLFSTFLAPMEKELATKSSYTVGRTHGVANTESYNQRIAAINYTLAHDDGLKSRDYDEADIILIGVSRSGKTPSCLYMALQFGILAANYPFTEEDFQHFELPEPLRIHKKKLFGLTIDTQRLQEIRAERRPNSHYASPTQCKLEISQVETMYRREQIPYLNSTRFSIEEIATKIMSVAGIKRKL